MKLLEFNKLTGFPLSATTMKFTQEQLLELQYLSLLGGNNYIISGCNNVGGTVSDGWVVVKGEVLKFVSGTLSDYVIIEDNPVSRPFMDETLNPYYHNRVAKFGTTGDTTTQFAWSSFEVNNPDNGVLKRLRLAETLLASLQTSLAATNTTVASKANISDVLVKGNTTLFTPVNDYDPATKKYVDNSFGIIAKGTINVGDIDYAQTVKTIPFGIDIGTTDYLVFASIIANDTHDNATICWVVQNKTALSFDIKFREVITVTQNVSLNWFVIHS